MDWTGCDLVEIDPEKVGGKPVVKGTRVPAEVVLMDEEFGRTPEQNTRQLSYGWCPDDFGSPRVRTRRESQVRA
jgi:uncharacterized protein (DUF433 family)